MDNDKLSKFLSMVLRHTPAKVGIVLDRSGWVAVDQLISGVNRFHFLDRSGLNEIVASDNQRRFSYNEARNKIRANYGHSVEWEPDFFVEPPDILYHGSATKYEQAIDVEGIRAKSRTYVHLSRDIDKATRVGSRHGELVIYRIDAKAMQEDSYCFAQPVGGVYLTKSVPVQYITKIPPANR